MAWNEPGNNGDHNNDLGIGAFQLLKDALIKDRNGGVQRVVLHNDCVPEHHRTEQRQNDTACGEGKHQRQRGRRDGQK